MRGTPEGQQTNTNKIGITPAHAGNTDCNGFRRFIRKDHPRTCGEHFTLNSKLITHLGSPPHMRGTPDKPAFNAFSLRITPAHAGNTSPISIAGSAGRDHPRTCGEHMVRTACARRGLGSPPHMRGTQRQSRCAPYMERITPAHAGNTEKTANNESSGKDHPRTCGEHFRRFPSLSCPVGSPPHMRGTQSVVNEKQGSLGITPAHAGNTRVAGEQYALRGDHPRTCGEH